MAAPGPTLSAQALPPAAHSTLIRAGGVAACQGPPVSRVQVRPPLAVRYSNPPAPSQPSRASLKQADWTLAGADAGCQLRPPSVVDSSVPPVAGISGADPLTLLPPASA